MGFFAEIASEARQNIAHKQTTAPPAAPAPRSAIQSVPSVVEAASSVPSGPAQKPKSPAEPTIDLTPKVGAKDNEDRKRAHEDAEARRKADFDARQAAKKAARQAQLERIAAMSDADILTASLERVSTDTEKLTRRNMKEAVAEHIKTKCRDDAAFARLVMHPAKTMINCFQYINRRAREYAEQEMKDNGTPRTGVYGLDVPDGLCYQWAEDYFGDPNVKEDQQDDEKFVPKPYMPANKAPKAKVDAKTEKKEPAGQKSENVAFEQMSLMS